MKNKNWGGARQGAGRKKDTGYYGEPTKVMRIPQSRVYDIKDYLRRTKSNNVIDFILPEINLSSNVRTLFEHKVAAGFPSPADEHAEKKLDLNDYLVGQKETTFFVRIKGDSMVDATIHDGDIDIVLASIDGEFTVKTLAKQGKLPRLLPANHQYPPIEIKPEMQFEIWGVVTGAVRKFK
jgi:DNA polymerase V